MSPVASPRSLLPPLGHPGVLQMLLCSSPILLVQQQHNQGSKRELTKLFNVDPDFFWILVVFKTLKCFTFKSKFYQRTVESHCLEEVQCDSRMGRMNPDVRTAAAH